MALGASRLCTAAQRRLGGPGAGDRRHRPGGFPARTGTAHHRAIAAVARTQRGGRGQQIRRRPDSGRGQCVLGAQTAGRGRCVRPQSGSHRPPQARSDSGLAIGHAPTRSGKAQGAGHCGVLEPGQHLRIAGVHSQPHRRTGRHRAASRELGARFQHASGGHPAALRRPKTGCTGVLRGVEPAADHRGPQATHQPGHYPVRRAERVWLAGGSGAHHQCRSCAAGRPATHRDLQPPRRAVAQVVEAVSAIERGTARPVGRPLPQHPAAHGRGCARRGAAALHRHRNDPPGVARVSPVSCENCAEVVTEQRRLLPMIRPERPLIRIP